jgi:hypothetical protein
MLVVLDITINKMTYIDQEFIELVSLLQDETEKKDSTVQNVTAKKTTQHFFCDSSKCRLGRFSQTHAAIVVRLG